MSLGERLFSEQEVGEIVRRAAELQEAGEQPPYSPGVTREELQRVAHDIGVDPRYLDQAIREALTPAVKKGRFNLTEQFDRVVDGELQREDFDVLLEHLRPGLNSRPLSQVGRTLTGQAKSGAVSLADVNVTSRNGRTKISVKSSPLLAYLIGLHPAVIGSFIAMGAMSERGMVAAAVGVSAALLVAGGLAFKKLVGLGHDNARKLADKLESAVAAESHGGTSAEQAAPTQEDEPLELRQGR